MSEVLIKNNVYESKNSAMVHGIHEAIISTPLDTVPYFREIILTKQAPIKNFDDKMKYLRIDSPEDVEIIFDGKSQIARYFEIIVTQPKNLTIKYHGQTQVTVGIVGGA